MNVISETDALASALLRVRGHWVIRDADLARFFGMPRRKLLALVERHHERFPGDFCFVADAAEWAGELETARDTGPESAHVFTEYGVLTAADLLADEWAITIAVELVRTFVRKRRAHEVAT